MCDHDVELNLLDSDRGGEPPRDVNVLMYMLPWVLDLGGPSVPGRGPFVTNICRAIFWAQDKYLSYTFALPPTRHK